jgi:8-oxo-dGTP pyrophosphatase MutT (NUDIX family)
MKDHGPWKIKSSEVKYKNPWIEVREDAVIRPDGTDGIFSVVTQAPGVSTLALDDDGFVYLVTEFRYAVGRDSIETVSGAVDEGESVLDAAKRELQEEAGISADEWTDLGELHPLSSAVFCPQHLFLARKLSFHEHNRESVEQFMEVKKMKFDEAIRMVMENEIFYGPSCVLILKAARYLGK